jgi:hypothetical protein
LGFSLEPFPFSYASILDGVRGNLAPLGDITKSMAHTSQCLTIGIKRSGRQTTRFIELSNSSIACAVSQDAQLLSDCSKRRRLDSWSVTMINILNDQPLKIQQQHQKQRTPIAPSLRGLLTKHICTWKHQLLWYN